MDDSQIKNLADDIFGESDDEDLQQTTPALPAAVNQTSIFDSDDDGSLFGTSDDEKPVQIAANKGKLKKGGAMTASKAPAFAGAELDSDEELDQEFRPKALGKLKKKRKAVYDKKGDRQLKRRNFIETEGKKDGEGKAGEGKGRKEDKDSGDEYDSGEEVQATKEDREFIDEDDEHAELVREYEEDNQYFDDERPEGPKGKTKSKGAPRPPNSSSSSSGGKNDDPLSETLNAMKKSEKWKMSPVDMENFIDKLQHKMEVARVKDELCYQQQQPALYKLQLLPVVQQAVSMKALHNTLLDKDFLCNLRDWIEPKDANTLPSLAVRKAVYDILLELPCLSEHLKRVGSGSRPIGHTIVALRKHKAETPENKKLLKTIMDKWSRPIFRLDVDGKAALHLNHDGNAVLNDDIHRAMLLRAQEERRKVSQLHTNQRQAFLASISPSNNDFDTLFSQDREGDLGSVSTSARPANTTSSEEVRMRARAPVNRGYLFTVQPESSASIVKGAGGEGESGAKSRAGGGSGLEMEAVIGEKRAKILRKCLESKGKKAPTGVKSNPRAVTVSISRHVAM